MLATTSKHVKTPERRTEYASFKVRSLTPHLGAEILGLDLKRAKAVPKELSSRSKPMPGFDGVLCRNL